MKSLLTKLLLVVFITTTIFTCNIGEQKVHALSISDLTYMEGGPSVDDPGSSTSNKSYYIDSVNGNDNNTGTKSSPWKTLAKIQGAMSGDAAGTHFLLKRGCTWNETLSISSKSGTSTKYIVLGAYGPLSSAKPKINGKLEFIYNTSYFMIRDLEVVGGPVKFDDGANNCIVYNNTVHGTANNAIVGLKDTSKLIFARNFVYDVASNDALVLHPRNWGTDHGDYADSHWIIDNVVVGNTGMEDCFDAASENEAKDIKVVGNRFQSYSIFGAGASDKGMSMGHNGNYHWIVGNIISGGGAYESIKLGTQSGMANTNRYIQMSGNIVYRNAGILLSANTRDLNAYHNTLINKVSTRENVKLLDPEAEAAKLNYNLISTVNTAYTIAPATSVALSQSNNNFFHASGTLNIDGMSFSNWKNSGYDTNSTTGSLSGISTPPTGTSWDDPRNWRDIAFLDYFIPSSSWSANNGGNTPGAFDSNGNWLGLEIKPFGSLTINNGYGWEGTRLVRAILDELGVVYNPSGTATPTPTPTPSATPTPTPSETLVKFVASADAQVNKANPTTNYGSSTVVKVEADATYEKQGFFKFTVSGVTGTVQSAKMKLYITGNGGTPTGQTAVWSNSNTGWTESGITWNTKPASTSQIASFTNPTTINTWVEVDVKSLITGDGTYSLQLITNANDYIDFASKNHGTSSYRPVLEVTYR